MEPIILLLAAGVAMALFSTLLMAAYTILEDDHRKKEIKRFVRRQIIKEMENSKNFQDEKVDLLQEYK